MTLICTRFDYNGLQAENHRVRVEGLQIINGGQTSKTVQQTLRNISHEGLGSAFVLVRLYQLPGDSQNLVQTITYATNSQNPVDLKDLRANDELQRQLEMSLGQLGFKYRRQRSEGIATSTEISVGTAAEAILSVWRRKPQQAKFRSSEHFGKLYDTIFTQDLNAAQVICAVLLFRIAENRRKCPRDTDPEWVRYASCFSAMLMGQYLLKDLKVTLADLTHRNFEPARSWIESQGEAYFEQSLPELAQSLRRLYGEQPVSLLRLSATFRRGDLLEYLL